jgi:hypothetical protein
VTPETDTERLLGHPFYDRDSEAAPWRGLLPPYDVEPDDEPGAPDDSEVSYA